MKTEREIETRSEKIVLPYKMLENYWQNRIQDRTAVEFLWFLKLVTYLEYCYYSYYS